MVAFVQGKRLKKKLGLSEEVQGKRLKKKLGSSEEEDRENAAEREWPASMRVQGILNAAAFFEQFPGAIEDAEQQREETERTSTRGRRRARMDAVGREAVEEMAQGQSTGRKGVLGQHVLALECVIQLEGDTPGKYDGPLCLSVPYANLTPEWRAESNKIEQRLKAKAAAMHNGLSHACHQRCRKASLATPNRDQIAQELGCEFYRNRLGRLEDVDFKYFIDGLEPELWWYRVVMLLEGVFLTAASRFFAANPTFLFGTAAAISIVFAALSYHYSPFLEDDADRIDVSTRAGNAMIFFVGFVRSLSSSGSSFNLICEYVLFCVSLATFFYVAYNFRPIERFSSTIKRTCMQPLLLPFSRCRDDAPPSLQVYRTVQAVSNAQQWTRRRIQTLKPETVRSLPPATLQYVSSLQADWFSEYHGQEVLAFHRRMKSQTLTLPSVAQLSFQQLCAPAMEASRMLRTQRLHDAIGLGDFDHVQLLLRQGNVDVNWASDDDELVQGEWTLGESLRRDKKSKRHLPGPSALILAARFGRADIVQMILELGREMAPKQLKLDVNLPDKLTGHTALIEAAIFSSLAREPVWLPDQDGLKRDNFSHTNVIKLLLEHGGDPGLVCTANTLPLWTDDGTHALHWAAALGSRDAVKCLIGKVPHGGGNSVADLDNCVAIGAAGVLRSAIGSWSGGRNSLEIARVRGDSEIVSLIQSLGENNAGLKVVAYKRDPNTSIKEFQKKLTCFTWKPMEKVPFAVRRRLSRPAQEPVLERLEPSAQSVGMIGLPGPMRMVDRQMLPFRCIRVEYDFCEGEEEEGGGASPMAEDGDSLAVKEATLQSADLMCYETLQNPPPRTGVVEEPQRGDDGFLHDPKVGPMMSLFTKPAQFEEFEIYPERLINMRIVDLKPSELARPDWAFTIADQPLETGHQMDDLPYQSAAGQMRGLDNGTVAKAATARRESLETEGSSVLAARQTRRNDARNRAPAEISLPAKRGAAGSREATALALHAGPWGVEAGTWLWRALTAGEKPSIFNGAAAALWDIDASKPRALCVYGDDRNDFVRRACGPTSAARGLFDELQCVRDREDLTERLRHLLEKSGTPRSILLTQDATDREVDVSTSLNELMRSTPVLDVLLAASSGDCKESCVAPYRQLLHFGREDAARARLRVGVVYQPSSAILPSHIKLTLSCRLSGGRR